jgi:hypothetical protein
VQRAETAFWYFENYSDSLPSFDICKNCSCIVSAKQIQPVLIKKKVLRLFLQFNLKFSSNLIVAGAGEKARKQANVLVILGFLQNSSFIVFDKRDYKVYY